MIISLSNILVEAYVLHCWSCRQIHNNALCIDYHNAKLLLDCCLSQLCRSNILVHELGVFVFPCHACFVIVTHPIKMLQSGCKDFVWHCQGCQHQGVGSLKLWKLLSKKPRTLLALRVHLRLEQLHRCSLHLPYVRHDMKWLLYLYIAGSP